MSPRPRADLRPARLGHSEGPVSLSIVINEGARPARMGYRVMSPQLSPDDAELDELWREAFGQPLPLLGAPEIAREILARHARATEER